jgi:hypothetical protein
MARSAGGGINSNKNVCVGVKTGAARSGVKPGWAGQIGTSLGNHATDGKAVSGAAVPMKTAKAAPSVKLGNEVALNSKSAPGQGRTIYKCGGQGQHGGVAGSVPGKSPDILSEYGPDRDGGKR